MAFLLPGGGRENYVDRRDTNLGARRMLKKYNSNGQKAYQREDREDRSLVYRDWLRTIPVDGFFMDLDMIKFKNIDGVPTPVAVTELTRCDREEITEAYLDAIEDRWFHRDNQASVILSVASKLEVPAYLVCFQKDLKWMWVFSFRIRGWKKFSPKEWAEFLDVL